MTGYVLADLPPRLRSSTRVNDITGCWEWLGRKNKDGYGQVHLFGTVRYVHRVSFELLVRGIPAQWQIDHLCRFHPCLNPAHLEVVTPAMNSARGREFRQRQDLRRALAHPDAAPALLADVLAVMGERSRLHSDAVCVQLAAQWPDKYRGLSTSGLASALRRHGVPTRQLHIANPLTAGAAVNRRGVTRHDLLRMLPNEPHDEPIPAGSRSG